MSRLIDADKIHPDVRTKREALAISQGQLAYAPTVDAIPIPQKATNGDMLKTVFPQSSVIVDGDYVTFAINNTFCCRFTHDWWNAPFKQENKDG